MFEIHDVRFKDVRFMTHDVRFKEMRTWYQSKISYSCMCLV